MLKIFGYFKDGAVIQRNKPVKVFGFADGEVRCFLKGGDFSEEKTAASEGAEFSVCFSGVSDTENIFELTAETDKEKFTAKVRFGDVYLMLGQSNMSYCLSAVEDCENWTDRAVKARISILNLSEPQLENGLEIKRPAFPQKELAMDYDWVEGKSEKISGQSAISVETAVLLSEKEGIPIGTVHTAMGGLSIESYMSREICECDPEILEFNKRTGRYVPIEDYNNAGGRNYTQTAGVWNEKIAPLIGIAFSGIIWYLGESSAWDFEFGRMFLREMKLLIGDYRKYFGNIPFVAVQIAPEYYPYGDKYGYLYINEALTLLRNDSQNIITIPIYDIEPRWLKANGDLYFHPIHTVNKSPVSERIAGALDGTKTYYPRIENVRFTDGKAVCKISRAEKGLKKAQFYGFTIADKDGKYYPAEAAATGSDIIEVKSFDVKEPSFLTYAFMQYQDFCNAETADELPLLQYRSVYEPVNKNYCFPPAFSVNGALEVYENNFGWQAGSCRKVKIWKDGELYDGSETKISSDGNSVIFSTVPKANKYYLFGISPAVCLTGHKNHFADYAYLNFDLCSDDKVLFLGIAVRTADGEMYSLNLKNGDKNEESLPVGNSYENYCVCLKNGKRGDGSFLEFTDYQRNNIVQAQFLFMAFSKVTLHIKNITLSDLNLSRAVENNIENNTERNDIKLSR